VRQVIFSCRHCGTRIHKREGVYVDMDRGDVCCADKFTEKNENGQHQPDKPEGEEDDWHYRYKLDLGYGGGW